jgi:hypothetical protein
MSIPILRGAHDSLEKVEMIKAGSESTSLPELALPHWDEPVWREGNLVRGPEFGPMGYVIGETLSPTPDRCQLIKFYLHRSLSNALDGKYA